MLVSVRQSTAGAHQQYPTALKVNNQWRSNPITGGAQRVEYSAGVGPGAEAALGEVRPTPKGHHREEASGQRPDEGLHPNSRQDERNAGSQPQPQDLPALVTVAPASLDEIPQTQTDEHRQGREDGESEGLLPCSLRAESAGQP